MEEGYYDNFIDQYNAEDYKSAHGSLLSELGKSVVTHREDFVHLLNDSGIPASEQLSDEQLISLFVDNIQTNKELALGASLLVQYNNNKSGADGPEVNDDAVKAGYELLSNAGGVVDSIAKTVGEGLKFGTVLANNKYNKQNAGMNALVKKKEDERAMQAAALKIRLAQEQAAAKKKAEAEKTKRVVIFSVIGVVALAAIIGVVIYIKKKK